MLSVKMFFSFFSFFFLDLNGNDSLTAIMTLSKEKENYFKKKLGNVQNKMLLYFV